ncbi:MAG TPA: IS21 family transposase [Orrella sp.]
MNVLKPHLQTTLLTLLASNTSQHEIARVTKIDRKTIRAYAKRWHEQQANSPGVATGSADQIPPPRPPEKAPKRSVSACEPHREFIQEQLKLRRNYTAIYQDLVDIYGFSGAYNSVKRFAGKLCQSDPVQYDRLEFEPAEEAQVDYGEGAMTRVPGTERYKRPRLFIMTLRYSGRSFRRVVWKSSKKVWAELHEQAFRYFGGATKYVVLDNLKEGVSKPDLYEPELNSVYAATLKHYGCVGFPARVRDPNRKGSVENAIGHTQATALKGRRFESIEEQNDYLEHWETRWAAQRIHGGHKKQVQAMFEEERPLLKPLPIRGMEYFDEFVRTVCDDACIRVDHSSYAARPAQIHDKVLVRLFDKYLQIHDLQNQTLLRTHTRAQRRGTVVLPDEDRIFNPSTQTALIMKKAKEIGPQTLKLCETWFEREGRVGQRKLWGIVNLAKHNPKRMVEQACEMALRDGVNSTQTVRTLVERLVADALAVLDTPRQGELSLTQAHPLIRSSDEYGDLFEQATRQNAEQLLNHHPGDPTP